MNERTKTGLEILQAAGLMGLLGNILLRETPWGLNAFLFVTAFSTALMMLMLWRRPELLTKTTLSLVGAMVFFASMFLIRDSIELRVYDTFAILIIMGVVLLANLDVKAHVAGAFHYIAGFIWSGLTSAFGPLFLLGSDIDWSSMPSNRLSRHMFSVLRGLAVALPLVLIFGALFMAADAAFEGLVNRAINFELDTVISHVVLTSMFAWLTAGYFRGALAPPIAATSPTGSDGSSPKNDTVSESSSDDSSFVQKVAAETADDAVSLPNNATVLEHINRSDSPNPTEPAVKDLRMKRDWQNIANSSLPRVFTFGTVETAIVLGLIDLLFLSFVIVQVPYLFGGMELVQNTPDFKLAEYARRGFGELVAVAAIVLPMLLVTHWLLRKETARLETLFRVLAGIQIALLFVIMASAMQRLVLLTGNLGYGMTTVRFYPMIFMIWLAIVFVWFAMTVLRGARRHFAWGALWSAIVVLGATNLMNPDVFIVRTNIALMKEGRDFDAYYNAYLSDDAMPALMESFADLSDADQVIIIRRLAWQHCQNLDGGDFRSWNYSRSRAAKLLNVDVKMLEQLGGCATEQKRENGEPY
jgi:hypothetical protein